MYKITAKTCSTPDDMTMWVTVLYQCLLLVSAQDDPDLVVTTADGPVLGGYKKSLIGTSFKSFQGIPFAAPPVGSLRFADPQPAEPWEEILDVSADIDIQCTQYGFMSDGGTPEVSGSEDCLYLNVYVPENAGMEEKMPVMMWIFGGYFQAGGNQWWAYGAGPFMDRNVIIVEPNHRLGSFGFTSLGIPEAAGNQGLKDLVAALKWINVNIDSFGGDPDSVTIFGESSGSWACSYLCMSPHASGLFHRAILQSGSLFNPYWEWQTEEDAVGLSTFMSTRFNCTDLTPYGQLECLQNLDKEILADSINWGTEETMNIQKILRPTGIVEGDFLPDIPTKLMERGEYNHVDLMLGMTSQEGLLQTVQFILSPDLYFYAKMLWDHLGPMFLFGRVGSYDTWPQDHEMTEVFTDFYLGGKENLNSAHFDNLTNMITDAYIWYGGHKQTEWAAMNGDNVYQYMFKYKGPYGYLDAYGVDSTKYGVAHSDELWYFWKPYFNKYAIDMGEEDEAVSKNVLDMWVNFGYYGDPTPPGSEVPVQWGQVSPDNHQYLIIDKTLEMALEDDYLARMAIWDETYKFPEGNTIPPQPLGFENILEN